MQTRLSARLAPSGALDLLLKRAFLALWTLTQTLIPCGESQEGDHYLSSTLPSQVSFQTQLSIPLLLLETLSSSKFSGSLAERPQCSDELQSKSSQLHVPPLPRTQHPDLGRLGAFSLRPTLASSSFPTRSSWQPKVNGPCVSHQPQQRFSSPILTACPSDVRHQQPLPTDCVLAWDSRDLRNHTFFITPSSEGKHHSPVFQQCFHKFAHYSASNSHPLPHSH